MMQKKYLLISLVTAATLLSGCSATGDNLNQPAKTLSAVDTGTGEDGLINPSQTEPAKSDLTPKNFEEGAVEVVVLPESITTNKDFVEVPLGEVSGSIVETEDEVTVVYNTYQGSEIRQWVKDLDSTGWEVSSIDTLDTPTSYTTFLTNGDKTIALYSTNTAETKNTVISFSK